MRYQTRQFIRGGKVDAFRQLFDMNLQGQFDMTLL